MEIFKSSRGTRLYLNVRCLHVVIEHRREKHTQILRTTDIAAIAAVLMPNYRMSHNNAVAISFISYLDLKKCTNVTNFH